MNLVYYETVLPTYDKLDNQPYQPRLDNVLSRNDPRHFNLNPVSECAAGSGRQRSNVLFKKMASVIKDIT